MEPNKTCVYVTALPKYKPIGQLECRERQIEIDSASSEKIKREKYFVWKLLCYALRENLDIGDEKLNFVKQSYGGWSLEGINFSLSHSGDALAVAVSSSPVGIDIERIQPTRSARIAQRIMNGAELIEFEKTPVGEREKRFIEIWTAKEAIFKSKHISAFIPHEHDTLTEFFRTYCVEVDGQSYVLSLATESTDEICFFENIEL